MNLNQSDHIKCGSVLITINLGLSLTVVTLVLPVTVLIAIRITDVGVDTFSLTLKQKWNIYNISYDTIGYNEYKIGHFWQRDEAVIDIVKGRVQVCDATDIDIVPFWFQYQVWDDIDMVQVGDSIVTDMF